MNETVKTYICLSIGNEYKSYLEKYNYKTDIFLSNITTSEPINTL